MNLGDQGAHEMTIGREVISTTAGGCLDYPLKQLLAGSLWLGFRSEAISQMRRSRARKADIVVVRES